MVIERFHSRYLLHTGKRDPRAVQKRLDGIVGSLLTKELHNRLSRDLGDGSPLYFIKKVEVEITLDLTGMNDLTIARIWSAEIASAIGRMLRSTDCAHPTVESDMLVFRDRTEYLARFIRDLIAGTAWNRWYYQPFRDLDVLAERDVVRFILERNPEIAEEILLSLLESGTLEEVLERLSEHDVERIYSRCIGESPGPGALPENKHILDRLITEAMRDGQFRTALTRNYKSRLKLYLSIRRRHPEFRRRAALRGRIDEIVLGGNGPDMETAAQGIHSERETFTSYGGLFLLARTISDLRLDDLIGESGFPGYGGASGLSCLLFFLALKIVGHERSEPAETDPGLLLFAGLEGPVNITEYTDSGTIQAGKRLLESLRSNLEKGLSHLDGVDLDESLPIMPDVGLEQMVSSIAGLILKVFARRLRGFEGSSAEYISRHILHRPSEIIHGREVIHVKLSRRPLDVVLRLSGMLEDINGVAWLNNRNIRFSIAG